MTRVLWLVPAILLSCVSAMAQDTPHWEAYGGYSYLHANFSGPGPNFNLNGGGVSVTENVNNWIGGRFEFNAYGGTVSGISVSAQTFTIGPVVSYRKFDRIVPYLHVQIGDVHASQGYLGISTSANKFALNGGGGLDVKINDRAAVRLQADYLMTRFLSLRQDNLQPSAGIVFYIGRR